MRNATLFRALVLSVAIAALARAQDSQRADSAASPSKAPPVGQSSKTLARFFDGTLTWNGQLEPGAIEPESEPATTHGRASCRALYGGFWYACDIEEKIGSGKDAWTRKNHMVIGYDLGTDRYRAFVADNAGTMFSYNGTLSGNVLVLETPDEVQSMGRRMRDRLTWELGEGRAIKFTNERRNAGGEWRLAESATVTRSGGGSVGSTSRIEGMGLSNIRK